MTEEEGAAVLVLLEVQGQVNLALEGNAKNPDATMTISTHLLQQILDAASVFVQHRFKEEIPV